MNLLTMIWEYSWKIKGSNMNCKACEIINERVLLIFIIVFNYNLSLFFTIIIVKSMSIVFNCLGVLLWKCFTIWVLCCTDVSLLSLTVSPSFVVRMFQFSMFYYSNNPLFRILLFEYSTIRTLNIPLYNSFSIT